MALALPSAGPNDATVKIEIVQELALDTIAMEDVTITVHFEDEHGGPVRASFDPEAEDAVFFIRVDELEGISGIEGGRIAPGRARTSAG